MSRCTSLLCVSFFLQFCFIFIKDLFSLKILNLVKKHFDKFRLHYTCQHTLHKAYGKPKWTNLEKILSEQFPIFGEQFSILGEQFSILGEQFSILGEQFSILGEQFSILGEQFSILGEQFPILGEQFPILGEQ